MKCEKLIRVIMRPIRKRLLLKKMSLKETKKIVFKGLKRLSKEFKKKKKSFLCMFYAFLMKQM